MIHFNDQQLSNLNSSLGELEEEHAMLFFKVADREGDIDKHMYGATFEPGHHGDMYIRYRRKPLNKGYQNITVMKALQHCWIEPSLEPVEGNIGFLKLKKETCLNLIEYFKTHHNSTV